MAARNTEPDQGPDEEDKAAMGTVPGDLAEPLPKAPPHVKPGAMLGRVALAVVMLVLSLMLALSVRALR